MRNLLRRVLAAVSRDYRADLEMERRQIRWSRLNNHIGD